MTRATMKKPARNASRLPITLASMVAPRTDSWKTTRSCAVEMKIAHRCGIETNLAPAVSPRRVCAGLGFSPDQDGQAEDVGGVRRTRRCQR
jgi:hypothetical protein